MLRTDVIVSSKNFATKSKRNFLENHFAQSHLNKNLISHAIFNQYKTEFMSKDKFYEINSSLYKTLLPEIIDWTGWETQKMVQHINGLYKETYQRYLTCAAQSLIIQNEETFEKLQAKSSKAEEKYQNALKRWRKAEEKRENQAKKKKQEFFPSKPPKRKSNKNSYEFVGKQTAMSALLRYCLYIDAEELDIFDIGLEKKYEAIVDFVWTHDINNLRIKEKSRYKQLQSTVRLWEKFSSMRKENGIKWKKFKYIIKSKQSSVRKRMKEMEFQTGSYIKAAVFNKNSEKPVIHSKVVRGLRDFNQTKLNTANINKIRKAEAELYNEEFVPYVPEIEETRLIKFFYQFKTPSEMHLIPLSYNERFFGNILDKYRTDSETWVTYKNGKLRIGLTREELFQVKFKETGKIASIDLNVRDNFCTIFIEENQSIIHGQKNIDGYILDIDYNREYTEEFVKMLKDFDRLSSSEKKILNNKQKLENLVNKNKWYFQHLIHDILVYLDKLGVSEIRMEDLDLSKTGASYVKSVEYQIKYSRLIRALRLSSIKDWMKRQAENFGIQVYFVNPAGTSQMCPRCGNMEKGNRNQAEFKCLECGFSTHADHSSPLNIHSRIGEEVLSLILNFQDKSDPYLRLIPKPIPHRQVMRIVQNYFSEHPLAKYSLSEPKFLSHKIGNLEIRVA